MRYDKITIDGPKHWGTRKKTTRNETDDMRKLGGKVPSLDSVQRKTKCEVDD